MQQVIMMNIEELRHLLTQSAQQGAALALEQYRPPERKAEKYLSTRDVAGMVGVSENTIRQWIRNGRIKATRQGKSFVIKKTELEKAI